MTSAPRAYRAIILILALWTSGRVLTENWPEFAAVQPLQVEAQIAKAVLPIPAATRAAEITMPLSATPPGASAIQIALDSTPPMRATASDVVALVGNLRPSDNARDRPIQSALLTVSAPPRGLAPIASVAPTRPLARQPALSASGWMLYRPGGGASSIAPGGQLGGSQAGVRVRLSLIESGGLSIGPTVRASSALRRGGEREIATGLSARIAGPVPIEIIAERRISLRKGSGDRFALLAATGVDDLGLPADFKLSGYAQAGFVGLKNRDGFVDGAMRIERQVTSVIRLGAGLWGAAQPGLSRVDVGPMISLRSQALGPAMRISAEWRHRVAGNAAGRSGPAITVGTDF